MAFISLSTHSVRSYPFVLLSSICRRSFSHVANDASFHCAVSMPFRPSVTHGNAIFLHDIQSHFLFVFFFFATFPFERDDHHDHAHLARLEITFHDSYIPHNPPYRSTSHRFHVLGDFYPIFPSPLRPFHQTPAEELQLRILERRAHSRRPHQPRHLRRRFDLRQSDNRPGREPAPLRGERIMEVSRLPRLVALETRQRRFVKRDRQDESRWMGKFKEGFSFISDTIN